MLLPTLLKEATPRDREARRRSWSQQRGNETSIQHGGAKTPTGEWICGRRMARLREIRLEFGDTTVKSDNELALTSLIEKWSTLRAMKGGSRVIVASNPLARMKSNRNMERAIQSFQGMVKTLRSSLEF